MAITKIGGIIRTGKVHNIIFVTVDESPHCIQIHYIRDGLRELMDLENVNILNYVVVNDELIEVSLKLILLSKKLSDLKESVNL